MLLLLLRLLVFVQALSQGPRPGKPCHLLGPHQPPGSTIELPQLRRALPQATTPPLLLIVVMLLLHLVVAV